MGTYIIICLDLCLYPLGKFICSICYILALFVVSSNSWGISSSSAANCSILFSCWAQTVSVSCLALGRYYTVSFKTLFFLEESCCSQS